ncbi:MAG: hypothetical protein JSS66_19015 [Armatimonadetes bacterium]|nr:hypothetical protein [Armatimonadota bacterium]
MLTRCSFAALGAAFLCLPVDAQTVSPGPGFVAGTITTGGTAQQLFGGAIPGAGWEVCNPDATNDLWVSDMGTAAANAAGSYRAVANGGCYLTPRDGNGKASVLGPVSIVGAVTGQKFSARKW